MLGGFDVLAWSTWAARARRLLLFGVGVIQLHGQGELRATETTSTRGIARTFFSLSTFTSAKESIDRTMLQASNIKDKAT